MHLLVVITFLSVIAYITGREGPDTCESSFALRTCALCEKNLPYVKIEDCCTDAGLHMRCLTISKAINSHGMKYGRNSANFVNSPYDGRHQTEFAKGNNNFLRFLLRQKLLFQDKDEDRRLNSDSDAQYVEDRLRAAMDGSSNDDGVKKDEDEIDSEEKRIFRDLQSEEDDVDDEVNVRKRNNRGEKMKKRKEDDESEDEREGRKKKRANNSEDDAHMRKKEMQESNEYDDDEDVDNNEGRKNRFEMTNDDRHERYRQKNTRRGEGEEERPYSDEESEEGKNSGEDEDERQDSDEDSGEGKNSDDDEDERQDSDEDSEEGKDSDKDEENRNGSDEDEDKRQGSDVDSQKMTLSKRYGRLGSGLWHRRFKVKAKRHTRCR